MLFILPIEKILVVEGMNLNKKEKLECILNVRMIDRMWSSLIIVVNLYAECKKTFVFYRPHYVSRRRILRDVIN